MKYEFRRDFYYEMLKSLEQNSVTFLLGTRKCGKTVCLGQLYNDLPNTEYVDFKTIPRLFDKVNVFCDIMDAIKADKEKIYLLDEITYVPDAESRICEIANMYALHDNQNTKVVFTGSQSVALNSWADRAFAGNAGKVKADFLTYSEFLRYKQIDNVNPETFQRFLFEVADFYKFHSLKDYLSGCIEETIISNANASNYLFDNECDLIKDNIDVLINICYQTMFTLHNHVNVDTFFRDNKIQDTIIGTFHEVCRAIESDKIAAKIEKSFVGSYSNIHSQKLDLLKQAFVFLQKCGLITITPIARQLDDVPNVYRGMRTDNGDINCKRDLFKKFNITINHPMFYVEILRDVLKEDMPEQLPGSLLGSITECYARGLLSNGFEFHPISDEEDIEHEIDYINLTDNVAIEFTVSNHHNRYFQILPSSINCTCLTKGKNSQDGNIKYIDYCNFLYELCDEKYSKNFFVVKKNCTNSVREKEQEQ